MNKSKEAVEMRYAIQHGEVMIVPVEVIPEGKTRQSTSEIVAHSETGHHHVIESTKPFQVTGDVDKQDLYLRLFEPAKLVHKKSFDAHRTLTIPAGDWKILHKTEYDPFESVIKTVKD